MKTFDPLLKKRIAYTEPIHLLLKDKYKNLTNLYLVEEIMQEYAEIYHKERLNNHNK